MNQRSVTSEIFRGMGFLFLLHLGVAWFAYLMTIVAGWTEFWLLGLVFGPVLLAPGIFQLFYVIPLNSRFRKQGRFNAVKGVVIGAVITVFINGGCFVYVLNNFHAI